MTRKEPTSHEPTPTGLLGQLITNNQKLQEQNVELFKRTAQELQKRGLAEQLENLQRACIELARGFEQATKLEGEPLKDALVEASNALTEVHRVTEQLKASLESGSQ
jgi:hypothetical protein